MLKIYGRCSAFNVQKVMWLIGELDLEHEHEDRGGDAGGLDDPAFVAMNPHGRVPVIDDGGVIVWESNSIVRYLCARYAPGRFWPTDPAARALVDRWMDWSLATLQRDFLDLFWGYYRTPEAQRDWPRLTRLIERCARHYQLLDRQLAGAEFLAGAELTMADIPAGTTLFRYFELDLERPRLPHVEAWYGRLRRRPAYRDHVMLPFDELRGRLAY